MGYHLGADRSFTCPCALLRGWKEVSRLNCPRTVWSAIGDAFLFSLTPFAVAADLEDLKAHRQLNPPQKRGPGALVLGRSGGGQNCESQKVRLFR